MKKLFFSLIIILLSATAYNCGNTPEAPTPQPSTSTPKATLTTEPTITLRSTETPPPTVASTPVPITKFSVEEVAFTTEDDVELAGTFFLSEGDGSTAVVLAHMAGESDQEDWKPFAKEIARRGISAVTFDFRCYGLSGCSGGSGPLSSIDLGAVIKFLHEQGFQQIICMGASMGGRGCISVAFDEELAGLIIISGTGASESDRQNLNDFLSPAMPKLFVVASSDSIAGRTQAMTDLFESAPEPKTFELLSGSAHGTELFSSKHKEALQNTIFDFLEKIRFSAQEN